MEIQSVFGLSGTLLDSASAMERPDQWLRVASPHHDGGAFVSRVGRGYAEPLINFSERPSQRLRSEPDWPPASPHHDGGASASRVGRGYAEPLINFPVLRMLPFRGFPEQRPDQWLRVASPHRERRYVHFASNSASSCSRTILTRLAGVYGFCRKRVSSPTANGLPSVSVA